MSQPTQALWTQTTTKKDWVDLRDQAYQPNLSVLRQELQIDHRIVRDIPGTGKRRPRFGLRNQGADGRCVGYALANVIECGSSI